ncbi:hypothetical protein Pcinc_004895 [Petrolisthes cinctipes]|uniref:Uncharacterized protein n=1 Tax=Petrolisthes cinctipes TaxID=88211 RepID=A0AAE1GG73_PETCI|nr:hypothetical protein Pcinc_004895 [Petrolisthes cinctipes]
MADIMLRQHKEGLYETPEFTESFFKFVTERVVLAQVKSEMDEVEVKTLLNRLISWSVEALVVHMRVITHSWGLCDISGLFKFGEVVHHRARRTSPYAWYPDFEKIWAVFEVQNAVGVGGPPLNVYVALSVGQQGWCVLTPNLHTLVHVLRIHSMSTNFLLEQIKCKSDCGQLCDELVPCVRPSKAPLTYQTNIPTGERSPHDNEDASELLKHIPEAEGHSRSKGFLEANSLLLLYSAVV